MESTTLVDRLAVQDAVVELFIATDEKDWDRVRSVFAPSVHFDMTSLAGGEPAELTPDAIVSAWEEGLTPVDAVHHQVGNFRIAVDGASAAAFCYGIAYHFNRSGDSSTVTRFVGSYDFGLVRRDGRWRVDLLRFNVKFVDET